LGLQTDDTLTLGNLPFADKEEELQKAKFLAKPREQLTHTHPIKFNGGMIKLADPETNTISLTHREIASDAMTKPRP